VSRRRYVYRQDAEGNVHAVEVTADYQATEERTPVYTDLYMDGLRATDGTDISSRSKRRAYMKANGLADADDYKETWAKAEKQREAFYRGDFDTKARREDVARAYHELSSKRRTQGGRT